MTEAAAPTTTETTAPSAPTIQEAAAGVWGPDEVPAVEVAPAAPEKPVEAAEEKKDPKADKPVSSRLAAAMRAEAKAERERVELRTTREALERQKVEQDRREQEIRLLEEDPSRYFEVRKLGPNAIAEHLEKLAGRYKPEAVQEQKLSTVEQELKALKDEIARRDAAEAQRTRTVEQTEREKAAGAAFVEHVTGAADKFPSITAEFTEEQAVAEAFAALNEIVGTSPEGKPITRVAAYHAAHGVYPDHDVIAEHLESVAKSRIEARSKAAWRRPGNAPPASQATPGEESRAPTVKGTSPRTLSRADTSQRAAAPRAAWSQEAADEESLRILEAALRKSG